MCVIQDDFPSGNIKNVSAKNRKTARDLIGSVKSKHMKSIK